MILSIILILLGFGLLILGAEWMVNGASALAKKYHISDLAIGLTIVAMGTSAPEMVVNTIAAFEGHSDIVFGNIIGSNNFNLFMILGIVGLIMPIRVQSSTVWKEIPISMLAAVVLILLANPILGQSSALISRWDGLILLGFFFGFLYYVYTQMRAEPTSIETEIQPMTSFKITSLIVIGIGGLVLGGKLVVDNAIDITTAMGVSEKIIGLTIIAAGTSLPELMTSVVAAYKKNSDIAIGNVVGSNIFNIFLILGLSSVLKPLEYNLAFNTDLYLLIGGTFLLFFAMFTGGKRKLDRWEAFILLAIFIAYTIYLISKEL
jgi:cation:H+ antiporter